MDTLLNIPRYRYLFIFAVKDCSPFLCLCILSLLTMRALLLSTIYPKQLLKRRIGGGFLLLLSHFISQRHKELLVRERPLGQSSLCPYVYLPAASAAPSSALPCHGRAIASQSVKINRFEAFKACSQHLLPLPCTQAHPANAPAHGPALGMETEMFEGPHEAVTPERLYQEFGLNR